MFHKSAAYYDLIYRDRKDYAKEADKLHYLLQLLEPVPKRLLDVGCGTGEHARVLREKYGYEVDGIDIEPAFVEIASAKNPGSDFSVADMRGFRLPTRYDVVLCLFSTIAYVETLEGLKSAFSSIAGCLQPGGWLICEPWERPGEWMPGQVDAIEIADESSGTTVTRTRLGSTEGKVSVLTIDYDITGPSGEQRFQEIHRLGLFTSEEMTDALRESGFSSRWAEYGLQGRSLLLATYLPE